MPAHVLEAIHRAITQPAESIAQIADASAGALRPRTAESFEVVWLAHPESGEAAAHQAPEPSSRRRQLLDALALRLPKIGPDESSHAQENSRGA